VAFSHFVTEDSKLCMRLLKAEKLSTFTVTPAFQSCITAIDVAGDKSKIKIRKIGYKTG
jgi:hypothetical protein